MSVVATLGKSLYLTVVYQLCFVLFKKINTDAYQKAKKNATMAMETT